MEIGEAPKKHTVFTGLDAIKKRRASASGGEAQLREDPATEVTDCTSAECEPLKRGRSSSQNFQCRQRTENASTESVTWDSVAVELANAWEGGVEHQRLLGILRAVREAGVTGVRTHALITNTTFAMQCAVEGRKRGVKGGTNPAVVLAHLSGMRREGPCWLLDDGGADRPQPQLAERAATEVPRLLLGAGDGLATADGPPESPSLGAGGEVQISAEARAEASAFLVSLADDGPQEAAAGF